MSRRRRRLRWRDAERDPFAMFVAPERKEPPFEQWWEENGFRELHQLLLWRWDPIGVADHTFPYAESEYDGYARRIAELLHDGIGTEEMAAHLAAIVHTQMGMTESMEPADRIDAAREPAELLVRWYEESRSWHREFGARDTRPPEPR